MYPDNRKDYEIIKIDLKFLREKHSRKGGQITKISNLSVSHTKNQLFPANLGSGKQFECWINGNIDINPDLFLRKQQCQVNLNCLAGVSDHRQLLVFHSHISNIDIPIICMVLQIMAIRAPDYTIYRIFYIWTSKMDFPWVLFS